MYQEVILDHYKHPQHSGLRDPFDAEVHHVNPSCGDELTLRVRLSDDGTTVDDVSYDAVGCSISQASTSVMAEEIIGRPVEEAMAKLAEFERMITSRGKEEGDEDLIGDGIAFSGSRSHGVCSADRRGQRVAFCGCCTHRGCNADCRSYR